ncbi:MAG TPA: esterase [Flavobacteriales bacterium]|nr:esterase [Flavobacteriales bacterium]|tara:strand:+ start:2831 stop:3841 length:1011 start_codon:yes stop_codon:yes gene_type:complete
MKITSLIIFLTLFSFISCKKDSEPDIADNGNPAVATMQNGWNNVSSFGANPGNLKMYVYKPSGGSSNKPVVIVLHGCSQDASMISYETDWNKLAEQYKFYVIYAEQSTNNNSNACFNWFLTSDQEKNQGEVASIFNMYSFLKDNEPIDASNVYVTGFSAGAGMAVNVLACYPEVFRAGAIFAGVPYKAATNATEAFTAMNGGISKTAQEWGDLVRNADTTFTGTYPKIAIFHGINDNVVSVANAGELEKQWTNLHTINTSGTVYNFDGNPDVSMTYHINTSNDTVVKKYLINNLMHAIPVDPDGTAPKKGGNTDMYTVDKNFFSTYWVAKFFNLIP